MAGIFASFSYARNLTNPVEIKILNETLRSPNWGLLIQSSMCMNLYEIPKVSTVA